MTSPPTPTTNGPSTGPPTLLLFPTELEQRRFADTGGIEHDKAVPLLCGFGPVAAAARTADVIAALKPRRVILVGIAGAYDIERHPVGSALTFARVGIDGIGVGEGERFLGPPTLGFPQWPGSHDTRRIGDKLELLPVHGHDDGLLLTTCAASDTSELAALRRGRFPAATAEDMEGFAVALACELRATPCTIIRGISNHVGDRNPENWRIPAAIAAARRLVLEYFEADARTEAP